MTRSDGAFDRSGLDASFVRRCWRAVVHKMRGAADSGALDRSRLLGWSQVYLPHHFRRPPSRMHRWLADELDQLREKRGQKINVIGPRGGAKSTVGSLAYLLRCAVEGTEPYIWLVSDTRRQACAHLENLKTELTENDRLRRDYPHATGIGPHWRTGALETNCGVLIEAYGTGQRIRGRRQKSHRPSLIVCDDVQNDGHMESARQRELSLQWFWGTLLKAGNKETNLINLATALHHDALALTLHRTPGWNSRIFRAVEKWPDEMGLWQEWEAIYVDPNNSQRLQEARAFYEARKPCMDQGAELLWPEEEDLYTLMCMRVEEGRAAFEREKQGSPIRPETCEWPPEYFSGDLGFNAWPGDLRLRVIALDPSKGQDARRGDYSAFVLLGVAASGELFVEANLARRPLPQMVADGVELCRWFGPDAFGIESNQFQELLGHEFVREFQSQGLVHLQPWTLENRVNKLVRIRRLGSLLSTKRLRFKSDSPGTRLLLEQLQMFPCGDHDDGPDALEMAIRLAGELLGAQRGDGLGDRWPIQS